MEVCVDLIFSLFLPVHGNLFNNSKMRFVFEINGHQKFDHELPSSKKNPNVQKQSSPEFSAATRENCIKCQSPQWPHIFRASRKKQPIPSSAVQILPPRSTVTLLYCLIKNMQGMIWFKVYRSETLVLSHTQCTALRSELALDFPFSIVPVQVVEWLTISGSGGNCCRL